MYVIFPADEVVYLSYGRLIVVPPNSTPESSNSPIRTNSLSPERTARDLELATNGTTSELEEKSKSPIIEGHSGKNQPSTSKQIELNEQQTTSKPKKRSLRLNFSLLRRSSSKSEPQQSSSRVRYSVGHKDQSGIVTPPSEAFKKFCNISGEPITTLPPREKSPLEVGLNGHQDKTSIGKRSSSSSKTSKLEEQSSKRSSKHSSSSSKSTTRPEKNSSPLPNHTGILKRSQSQIQRDIKTKDLSRKASTSNSLTAEAAFYPLSTSREKNLVEPSPEPVSRFRSSSFRLNLRRSKTPECQPARPERKKEKKITKPKPGLERKLSFSDYLAVSREKWTDDRAQPLGSSDRDIAREKSPVLSFFRKTPSPKNLGRDRTPYLSREGLHSNLVHETQFEDIPRPPSTGQKHTSGEGSIMRVAIFTTTNY